LYFSSAISQDAFFELGKCFFKAAITFGGTSFSLIFWLNNGAEDMKQKSNISALYIRILFLFKRHKAMTIVSYQKKLLKMFKQINYIVMYIFFTTKNLTT